MTISLFCSHISSLPLWRRGKVRDIYEIDDQYLLIVTTDRLMAFDVVLPTAIPNKGKVLTALSNFWMRRLSHVIPNHLTSQLPGQVLRTVRDRKQAQGRSVVVKRVKPLPIDAIVRGYITDSGWDEYCLKGSVCGLPLPGGLQLAQRLPEPIFTHSTRTASGVHDENIEFESAVNLIGAELSNQIRLVALQLYREAACFARKHGVIIADTRFEFGLDDNGRLLLINEPLTPDSSHFWSANEYHPGSSPPSFDKQYIRDFLLASNWDPANPPVLPGEVVQKTVEKYHEVLACFTAP